VSDGIRNRNRRPTILHELSSIVVPTRPYICDLKARQPMDTSEPARHCHRCGAVLVGACETVPYVGPGPHVVQLHAVYVQRCAACAYMLIEVPEPTTLNLLIQCLGTEMAAPLPQLAYEMGHWCILPRSLSAAGATPQLS